MSGHVAENICTLLLMNTERMHSVCTYTTLHTYISNLAAAVVFLTKERKENEEEKGGEEEEETIKKD